MKGSVPKRLNIFYTLALSATFSTFIFTFLITCSYERKTVWRKQTCEMLNTAGSKTDNYNHSSSSCSNALKKHEIFQKLTCISKSGRTEWWNHKDWLIIQVLHKSRTTFWSWIKRRIRFLKFTFLGKIKSTNCASQEYLCTTLGWHRNLMNET